MKYYIPVSWTKIIDLEQITTTYRFGTIRRFVSDPQRRSGDLDGWKHKIRQDRSVFDLQQPTPLCQWWLWDQSVGGVRLCGCLKRGNKQRCISLFIPYCHLATLFLHMRTKRIVLCVINVSPRIALSRKPACKQRTM